MATITIAAIANAAEAGLQGGQFLLTLSEALTSELTVFYRVTGTATRNNDYSLNDDLGQNLLTDFLTGTVTIAAGETTARITVNPVNDALIESPETVTVTLLDGDDYDLGATQTQATVTIASDDTDFSLAVSPGSVDEDGTTNLVYTFTREGVLDAELVVGFGVAGNAVFNTHYAVTGATDFDGNNGTVTFAAGSATATVTIDPTPNTVAEADKTIQLILNGQAVEGTIVNNDTNVTLAVAPGEVVEDNVEDNNGNLVYTFTRVGVLDTPLTVNFGVAGTATLADSDYQAFGAATFNATTGSVTFASGEDTATVTIDPTPDTKVEPNETVALTLANGTGYTIGTSNAITGTIRNDDTRVTLAVARDDGNAATNVAENGDRELVYTFTRTGVLAGNLVVFFDVGGTATVDDNDYGAIGNFVVIPDGQATATVIIDPTPDTKAEGNETVSLTLKEGNYAIGTTTAVTGTINNDDTEVALTVSPGSVTENGTGTLVYTFTRTGVNDNFLVINFDVTGTAQLAAAPADNAIDRDYLQAGAATFGLNAGQTNGAGTVNLPVGVNTATVTIDPNAGTVREIDETVTFTLTAGAYTISADENTATGVIADDDDPRVTLTVSPDVDENGTPNLVYTFTRTGTTGTLDVFFNVTGTALKGAAFDYTANAGTNGAFNVNDGQFAGNGSVRIAAGSTTATVTIDPIDDVLLENDEAIVLTLVPDNAYTIPADQRVGGLPGGAPVPVEGKILDNDANEITLAVAPGSVQEDGNANLVYTFTRIGNFDNALVVSFDVRNGDPDFDDATFNDDYTAVAEGGNIDADDGFVTILAGVDKATVTIIPIPDVNADEEDETVALTLNLVASAGNDNDNTYTIATTATVEGTIVDDDATVTLAVAPGSVAENGTTPLVYTFTRDDLTPNELSKELTVNFTVGDGFADNATFGGANADYTQVGATTFNANTGTVTFAANSRTATVTITPTGDTTVEDDEVVVLTLVGDGPGTGYTIGNPNVAIGEIANDDTNVTFAINRGSVDEDGIDNLVYTFTREGELDTPLTVQFDVAGTATFGSDYQAIGAATFSTTAGTVTFASGSATATVTIDPTPDGTAVNDGDETVKLTLKPVTGSYTIGTTEVEGTINNDDAIVTLAATPASVLENGQTNLVYTFTRSGSTNGPLTVNFNVGGTATLANNDYQAIGAATFDAQVGTVTFASGSSTATVTIDPRPDTTSEGNETVALTLTGGADYTVGTTTAVTGTITNDDTLVTLAILPGNVNEDNSQNLVYTFTRTGILTNPLTVNFTVDGDATFGGATADYNQTGAATFTATTGTVTFAAGSATATVTIDPRLDTTVEPDEFIDLALTTGTGYTVGTVGAVTGRINNDDTRITLALNQSSVDEDGGQNLGYTFTRTGLLTNFLTVNFNIGGDAISGTDYQANQAETFTGATGTVLFAPGQGQVTVNIDPTGDTTVEEDETVALTLAEGSGDNAYTIGTTGALTGTILNDDNPPGTITLAVSPASVLENGTTNLVYTFTRSGTPDTPLTVNFNRGGTAIFGNDYTQTGANAAFNQVTFASNSSTATVTIDPTGDTTIEADETVALTLVPGNGYTVGTTRPVTATIQDDDAPRVSLAVSSPVAEDGTNNLLFTFTRPAQTATSVLTVNYSIGGTAILNNDYTVTGAPTFTGTAGTVTFAAGVTTAIVTIDPTVDTAIEEDETVSLILTEPVLDPANTANYYNVGTVGAVEGTILNDDTIVTLAVSPASVNEDGESNLEFTFTRTGGTTNALTVNYTVAGDGIATAGTDYIGATTGSNTVTFEAGEATATVTIDPTVDGTIEPNETVALTLATGTGYTIGTSNAVIGTIADDDLASISLTVSPDVDEDGEATLEYTFVRVGSTANALTINYTVAGTADLDTDYTVDGAASFTATTGTVTFEVGSATATVTIDPTADTTVEDDETVILTLAEDAGYIRNTTTAVTGTIANDDTIVTLAVSPVSVLEDQTTNLVYTFTREGVEDEALTVNFTVGGTANLATDYLPIGAANFAPTTGTVTFASGETTATVTIDPTVDTTGENDETVVLTLATGDGYLVGTEAAVTGTILNDDVALPSISLAVSPDSVEEDGEGNLVYTFTRTLTAEALEVNFTVGGDAIFGGSTADYTVIGADDFNGVTGSLTFATGSATATVRIDPTSDTTVEDDETVTLTLAAGTDYTIDTTAAVTGTIADDDAVAIPTATIAATDNAASEQGDNPGEFTITLSAAPTADVVLTYTVAGTAATNGSDYTALDGTVTVLAGETTATIAVLPVEDAIVEGNESVIVTLTDGAAYDLGAATVATVTIADSVITDIDGNTDINDADIALVVDFLLGATPGELESTFNQYSSLTEGASNTTAEELAASIESQLSLFDIDGSGETTTADIFVINSYILFQDLFGGSRPAIESQLASLAEDLSLELTGPNTTGPGLYNTLSALFV